MSGYSNYGRGNFQPKPRPQLPKEHDLNPTAEAAIQDKRELKQFANKGPNPNTQTTVLNSDPSRANIDIPKVALMAFMQCGIHPENQNFPAIGKFDTRYDANHYYILYEGPIAWKHDSNWRHIPCFTRYVIDKFGRILNAHNGTHINPDGGFIVELVPDGPANRTTKTPLQDLLRMAFTPLPEGFRDYGFRTYSHEWKTDPESGKTGWIPRPKVKCKDNSTGNVMEFSCLPELKTCLIKDYEQQKEITPYIRSGLNGETINIGDLTIRESEPSQNEKPAVPNVADANDSTETASEPSVNEFEDIDF